MRASATEPLPEPGRAPGGDPWPACSPQRPVAALVRNAPPVLPPDATLREALALLAGSAARALVVVDPVRRMPLGLVTLRDALARVAAAGSDLLLPVAAVMSGGPITLPADATVHQATVRMVRRRVHHLVLVTPDGRFAGLLAQSDLYGFPGAHAAELADAIVDAGDLDTVAALAGRVRAYAARLLAEGVGAEALCQILSALNDLVTLQVIDLVGDGFDLPYVPWSWLVFGSEGRLEQTLATDQDNGLIFLAADAAEADALRARFLPFCQAVNAALDRCGYPLCRGQVMAGNPRWCLSLAEWKAGFAGWLEVGEPEAILNATIFFDFRALMGEEALAAELRAWLLPSVAEAARFRRLLAENALEAQPPLSWWRDFAFDGDRAHPHTLDLKTQGVTPFVDAARLLALTSGVAETNTAGRLRHALAARGEGAADIAALTDAFFHIQRLRLAGQLGGAPADAPNRLDPDCLNELDRHILKESFRQARRLQTRLRLDYGL